MKEQPFYNDYEKAYYYEQVYQYEKAKVMDEPVKDIITLTIGVPLIIWAVFFTIITIARIVKGVIEKIGKTKNTMDNNNDNSNLY